MHTTTYGYFVPDQGDKAKGGAGWFAALEANFNRLDSHNHDGINSPVIDVAATLPFLNLKDFGAVGNGIADDSAALAAAVAAAILHNRTLYCSYGTYLTSSSITVTGAIRIVGDAMRATVFKYTGGAGKLINVTSAADNFEMHSITLDNSGSATHGIYLQCPKATLSRIYASPTVAFSTAAISTDTAADIYQVVLRDSDILSTDISQVNPIGFYGGRGHTISVENCFFSGCAKAIVCGGAGSAAVIGFSIINSRIEAFSGVGTSHPGSTTALGVEVVKVEGLNITGCNFAMDKDGDASATTQLAIKLTSVKGGNIAGNYFHGNGVLTTLINLAASTAVNVKINGNSFNNFGPGYAVTATGGGSVWANEIGENYIWDTSASSSFNNSWTPAITFGGGATGITYTTQKGKAQRIGKFITANFSVVMSSKGSSTGAVRITGLPVASDNNSTLGSNFNTQSVISLTGVSASVEGHITAYLIAGDTKMRVFFTDPVYAVVDTEVTDARVDNATGFHGSITYEIP